MTADVWAISPYDYHHHFTLDSPSSNLLSTSLSVVNHNHRNCLSINALNHARRLRPRPEYRTGLTVATKLTSRLVSTRVIRRHAALSVPTSKNVDNLNLPYAVQQFNDRCASASEPVRQVRRPPDQYFLFKKNNMKKGIGK